MKMYVGNLSRDISEDELRQEFAAFGAVDSAVLIKDKFSGTPKGFGFVEMSVRTEAEAAIAGLNDTDMNGRNITVNEAREKRQDNRGNNRSYRPY